MGPLSQAEADPVGLVGALGPLAIVDEIQRVPSLVLAMKAAVDRDRVKGRFLITASADITTLPTMTDSLAGRMAVFELFPFAQAELESFVYQTAKRQWFGINVDLGDRPLTSLFSWAIDALREDPLVYVLTAMAAVGLVAAASVFKYKLAGRTHCRESADACMAAAIVVAVAGSSWFAWRDGAKKASDYWNNDPKFKTCFVFLKQGESQPQLYGSRSAPTPVYLLSQATDMYEILLQQPKAPMRTFLVHRADVGLITNSQPQATAPGNGDRYKVTLKKAIATPPPGMTGDS